PVEVVLQGKDVDPALVVAGDQIPAVMVQLVATLDDPLGTAGQAHPATVECHPALGNADHYPGQKTLPGRDGQQCLEQRAGQQQAETGQGAEDQQQTRKSRAEGCSMDALYRPQPRSRARPPGCSRFQAAITETVSSGYRRVCQSVRL